MNRVKVIVIVVVVVLAVTLLVVAGYFGGNLVYQNVKFSGYHVHVQNHAPGPCRRVTMLEEGSEDVSLLPEGLLLISSGLNFMAANSDSEGNIYLMDMKKPSEKPVKLTITSSETFDREAFNPLGTTYWQENGKTFLYVVNLDPVVGWVEKFQVEWRNNSLVHKATFKSEHFNYVNSLHAVGEDQFYFSNYLNIPSDSHFLASMEQKFRWYIGDVGFYDKGESWIVADDLLFPNGLTVSQDGKFLYLSHIGEREVIVFSRNKDNSLEKIQEYPLYTVMDNLKIDPETGDIWTGTHPVTYKIFEYLHDTDIHSPSTVLRLKTGDNGMIEEVTEIYADNGTYFSGASVAIPYNGYMFAGAVATHPIICKLSSLEDTDF